VPRRVAITGIGIVCPLGLSAGETWKAALAGTGAVADIPDHWWRYTDFNSTLWAPLPEFDFSDHGFSRPEQIQADQAGMLGIMAVREALEDAGLECSLDSARKRTWRIDPLDPERTGVFAGTGVGGINSLLTSHNHHINYRNRERLRKAVDSMDEQSAAAVQAVVDGMQIPRRFNPMVVPMTMPNACSSTIGIRYSLHGINNTFTGACAAGTIALGNAAQAIRNGTLDVVLSGGAEFMGDECGAVFHAFDAAGALVQNCDDADRANRPFDKERSGFLFGEGGAAFMVLEELGAAQARGARIYAEIAGYGETFDAHSQIMIEPGGEQIRRCLEKVLDDAGLESGDIDYVNTHGTGTRLNDEVESRILAEVFGDKVAVNSTKSLIGHAMGASGAIETAITALSIHHQTTHPCRNLDDPVNGLNFVTASEPLKIDAALSESFAFGGHNSALVLKRVE